jgi:hypothetical protein
MKRLMIAAFVVALLCFALANAQASVVTLSFDPNDLMDLYPAQAGDENVTGENKATQLNARRYHQVWTNPYYETFYNPANPQVQPASYDAYVSWLGGLGEGDGIAVFNSWLVDGVNAQSWGEKHMIKSNSTVSATSLDGWNFTIINNPYNLGGAVVQWYTLDPSKRLRPGGADIGNFTMTADLYLDNNANGEFDAGDVEVETGDTLRMWFGNLNGDDPGFYRTDTQAIFFDGAVYSNAAGVAGSGFEGVLDVAAIPEPATVIVWSLLGLAAAGYGLWRRNRAA